MSSLKQIQANRLNTLKSTGPKTSEGKERSRCNAIRHGLTAETVIVDFEDAGDYEAFEATVIADHDARSAVERELVLRLASVLWRLRGATGIGPSLFESVIKHQTNRKYSLEPTPIYCCRGCSGILKTLRPIQIPTHLGKGIYRRHSCV